MYPNDVWDHNALMERLVAEVLAIAERYGPKVFCSLIGTCLWIGRREMLRSDNSTDVQIISVTPTDTGILVSVRGAMVDGKYDKWRTATKFFTLADPEIFNDIARLIESQPCV